MEHHYFIPAVALSAVLGFGSFFAYRTSRHLAEARSELAGRIQELDTVTVRATRQRSVLVQMKGSAAPSNTFMARWHGALGAGHDANAMLTDLSRFGNEQAVSVQNRKSGPADYSWKGKASRIQLAEGEGISSEYYRLINWMGLVEHAWPIVRFEQVTFEQRGASLRLFLKLSYPTFLQDPLSSK